MVCADHTPHKETTCRGARARAAPRAPGGGAGGRARSDSTPRQAERHPEIMPALRRLPEMPESQQRRREIGVALSRRATPSARVADHYVETPFRDNP